MQRAVLAATLVFFLLACCHGRRLLPDSSVFNQDISSLPKHSNSDNVMAFLEGLNGGEWPNNFQIETSFYILQADSNFVELDTSGYYISPDCDAFKPDTFPVPSVGGIEATDPPGYSCSGGDCHLLVVDKNAGYFYEAYQANVAGGKLETSCALRWCMSYDYPGLLGDQCTSADAAGYPIIPLLFTVDELDDGVIDHALRMTLPNPWFGSGYVSPATHGTNTTGAQEHSFDPDCPYYGYRFRLKSSFDDSSYNAAEKIVITALKTYGVFLADGGNFALMMANDAFSETGKKYEDDFNFNSQSLVGIPISEFEVVQSDGNLHSVTYNCDPNPAPTSCSATGSASGSASASASASNSGSNSNSGGSSSPAGRCTSWAHREEL